MRASHEATTPFANQTAPECGSDSPRRMWFHANQAMVLLTWPAQPPEVEATGGLGVISVRRGRLGCRVKSGEAQMDWVERFFVALTMFCAVSAALSIVWIMLI